MIVHVVTLLWAALAACIVYRLLAAEELSFEASGTLSGVGAVAPSTGAAICMLFPIAAPAVLGWARGARGVFEGLGVLLLLLTGSFATVVTIVVVAAALAR